MNYENWLETIPEYERETICGNDIWEAAQPQWNADMSSAPKDRPILAVCDHYADPVYEDVPDKTFNAVPGTTHTVLTGYANACESFQNVDDGIHVIQWVKGHMDSDGWENPEYWVPGYWEVSGVEDICANPVKWMELPQ